MRRRGERWRVRGEKEASTEWAMVDGRLSATTGAVHGEWSSARVTAALCRARHRAPPYSRIFISPARILRILHRHRFAPRHRRFSTRTSRCGTRTRCDFTKLPGFVTHSTQNLTEHHPHTSMKKN